MTHVDRILTTHVGSLPRPTALLELNRRRLEDDQFDSAQLDEALAEEVERVVERQAVTGVDLRNDGEFGHAMAVVNDYSSWWSYMFTRLDGFSEERHQGLTAPVAPSSFNVQVVPDSARRDAERFPAVYEEVRAAKSEKASAATVPVVERATSYIGHDEIARDVANLKAALGSDRLEDGFICAVGPGSLSMAGNTYYKTHEEFVWACADVMAHEYKAIADAGLTVQIDEPSFAESWDAINPEPSLEDFREYTMLRVEALNHALKGIPREQVRFHCCWGSWHGPHSTDIELKHIVGMLLKIDANIISFEAANVRHEHEWSVWEDVRIPDGVKLAPGLVSHATGLLEHPELVAQRIERFASVVGRENVIASTDCGMGGRLHPDLAWAKLESLAQGAQIATKRLWK